MTADSSCHISYSLYPLKYTYISVILYYHWIDFCSWSLQSTALVQLLDLVLAEELNMRLIIDGYISPSWLRGITCRFIVHMVLFRSHLCLASEFAALLAACTRSEVTDISRVTTYLVDVTLDATIVAIAAVQSRGPSVALAIGVILAGPLGDLKVESAPKLR